MRRKELRLKVICGQERGLYRRPPGLPGTLQQDTNPALNPKTIPAPPRLPTPASTTHSLTLFPTDKARVVFNNAGPHLTHKRGLLPKNNLESRQREADKHSK